jgi:hypothetical protein
MRLPFLTRLLDDGGDGENRRLVDADGIRVGEGCELCVKDEGVDVRELTEARFLEQERSRGPGCATPIVPVSDNFKLVTTSMSATPTAEDLPPLSVEANRLSTPLPLLSILYCVQFPPPSKAPPVTSDLAPFT